MNVKLRKRHRYMWFVIGIGLPLLCLEAIEGVQISPTAEIARVSCPADITDCGITERHVISDHAIDISVKNGSTSSLIQISYTQPIVSAFTVAYLTTSEEVDASAKLIGSLHKMDNYSFEVPNESLNGMSHIIIYDKLNDNTLFHQPLNELNK